MIVRTTVLLVLVSFISPLFAQDSTALFKEAQQALQNRTKTAQDILTDPRFLSIHPQTEFRQLIKDAGSSSEITYTTASEPGKKITVVATVKDNSGKPVANQLVYCYQTDTRGWYSANAPHVTGMEGDRRHARLFAYIKTDKNGQFKLHTVQPNGYPQSTLPGHIHVEIVAEGYRNIITEFLFDDDPRLTNADIRSRSTREGFSIAKGVNNTYSYTLTLEKE